MKKFLCVCVWVLVMSFLGSCTYIIPQAKLSAVSAVYNDTDTKGSAFFIDNNGLMLTCEHLLTDGKLNVTVENKEYTATVVKVNKDLDMALVQVDYKPKRYLRLQNIRARLNENIKIISNNGGFGISVIDGKISKETTEFVIEGNGVKMFLIDSNATYGSSGAPVINSNGELIGMVAKKYSKGDITFAITCLELLTFVNS